MGLLFLSAIFISTIPVFSWPLSSNQSDNYLNWDIHTKELNKPGKDEFIMEINDTHENLFEFAWRLQNLSQSRLEFYINSEMQDYCKSINYTKSNIYYIKKGDVLLWRFSYLGSESNKAFLAFHKYYDIEKSNETEKSDFFSASLNESPQSVYSPVGSIESEIIRQGDETNGLQKTKRTLLIKPFLPKESVLSLDVPILFKFISIDLTKILYCTLILNEEDIYIHNK